MLRSETAHRPELRAAALAGLRRYQHAPRPAALPPLPVAAQVGRATLRRAGGGGRPVVFIPSLINPPAILDLAPDASLLRHVAAAGHDAYLVDWGAPSPDERELSVAGHVEQLLLPLLERFAQPPVLVGYCLGGTMALAAACATPAAGLATIAAPWRFAGYGEAAAAAMRDLWHAAEPACARLGLVPMEVLQAGFWQLDPARTVAKYARFATLDPDGEAARAFVRLEDWANAGAPLTLAAGRDLFTTFAAEDRPGIGGWQVAGGVADPAALRCPAVEFVATGDRIVPAATAAGLPDRRVVAAGHVGMVIGSRARSALWAPLLDWLDALPAGR